MRRGEVWQLCCQLPLQIYFLTEGYYFVITKEIARFSFPDLPFERDTPLVLRQFIKRGAERAGKITEFLPSASVPPGFNTVKISARLVLVVGLDSVV